MAKNKVPDGYKWVKEIDPKATYNSKTKTIETEYKTYSKDEYMMIDGKAYVADPYVGRYKNPKQLEGLQHDPSQMKAVDFKQDYTVVIRKKTYYAITQGNDEDYLEIFQINNFMNLRTSHNVYGKASASVTMKGGSRVIVSSKKKVKDKGWNSFQEILKGWNTIDIDKWGEYKGVQYNDLQRTREKAYDWAFAEKCSFEPMDEIYIYAKSPKRSKNGEYPFVQIFFGYISTVQKTYQAGQTGPTITISADDQLKLLSISRIANKLPQAMNVGGTAYRFDGAGNFIVETDFTKNGIDIESRNKDGSYNPATYFSEYTFTNMFAGRTPHEIIRTCCIEAGIPEKFLKNRIEKISRTPFTPQLSNSNDLFQGDFKTRYYFCQEAANKLNLEFYADEEGNIVLKIPSYNIGINKLKANNLGVDVPVTYDKNFEKTIKLTSLNISTKEPDKYYITLTSESLYDIARNFLNNGALWTELWKLNPHIKNVNVVPKGTRILISEKKDTTQKIDKSYKETITLNSDSLSGLTDTYIPVIYPEQIVSFSFVDSDKELYTAAQVTVDVPFIQQQSNAVPVAITRAVADFEMIKKFGYRDHPQTNTPIVYDANGAAIYAGLLLTKSYASRYTGSITIIENASIKVGEPVRFLMYDENPFHELYKFKQGNDNSYAQAVFYVDAIERSINISGVSFMTLTLKAGRMMGMPSIFDQCQELYRYYYEDTGLDLSLPQKDLNTTSSTTTTTNSNNTSNNSSGGNTGGSSNNNNSNNTSNSSNTTTKKQKEEDTFKDYTNGNKGYIHTVLNSSGASALEAPYKQRHLLNFSIYPESIQKISEIVYGNPNNTQKIINANKNKPDGLGGVFNSYLSNLKPGQKIRIPHTVSMGKYPVDFKNKFLK